LTTLVSDRVDPFPLSSFPPFLLHDYHNFSVTLLPLLNV
jgi:hypothetical protein